MLSIPSPRRVLPTLIHPGIGPGLATIILDRAFAQHIRLRERLKRAGATIRSADNEEQGMAAIDLKSLVGRLNEPCRRALEAAAGLTLSRTHYNVEIEHWLLRLADPADGDIAAILRHYEVDQSRLVIDLNRAFDKMKTGN